MVEVNQRIVRRAQRFVDIAERTDEELYRWDFVRSAHASVLAGREDNRERIAGWEVIGATAWLGKEAARSAAVMTVLIPELAYTKIRLGLLIGNIDVSHDQASAIIAQNHQ